MLINTAQSRAASIAVPVFSGKRGHPVLFSRDIFPELLSPAADEGAHTVVRRIPSRVLEVGVEDPGVIEDIDTPEAYRRLLDEVS